MLLRPVVAALAVVLPLSFLVPTAAAQDTPEPVAPVVHTVPLGPVEPAATASGATAQTASSVQAVSPEVPVGQGVRVVGMTWTADGAGDVLVEVRHLTADVWSTWESLDVEPGASEGEQGARAGTEPYVLVDSQAVQMRLSAAEASAPSDARVEVVDPGASPADESTEQPVTMAATSAQPTVRSRAAWGADESLRKGTPSYSPVKAAVIHHTAGSNSYSESDTPAVIRGIYAFHVKSRGWSDIGYNMMSDKYGRLWEGRAGGIDKGVIGAHVANYNTGSFGISVMGSYEYSAPNAATLDVVTRAIAWKLSLSGVSATSTTTLGGKSVPTVLAHRDLGQTACPGQAFYNKIPGIRTNARSYQLAASPAPAPAPVTEPAPAPAPAPVTTPEPAPVPTPVPLVRDMTGDGLPDFLSRTSSAVRLSPRVPLPVHGTPQQVGSGWQGMDRVIGTPDMGGDGLRDVVARQPSTGRLWLYHGNGRGGFRAASVIGSGWNGMSHLIAPGDWSGDGEADVIGVHAATGRMYLFRGTGRGSFASSAVIGYSWQGMRLVTKAGDLDGDRRPDLVALGGDGRLRLYSGTGRGGFLGSRVVAEGWTDVEALLGTGDFDGDGRDDLMTRSTAGVMTTFHGRADGSFDAPMAWGQRWGALVPLDGPGDMDRDGKADLLAVSRSTGALLLYRGVGARHFGAARPVALPATDLRHMFVVGNVDAAGRADVITGDHNGRLFLSLVTGNGVMGTRTQIGSGWQGMDVVTAAGDLSGDGVPDVLARQASTGNLYVYPLSRTGRFSPAIQVGSGWNGFDLVVGVGPWDDGPTADVVARRRADGALYLYKGTDSGKLSSGQQIGSRWGGMRQVLGAGDLNRDGHADLLGRTADGTDLVYRGNGLGGFAGTTLLQGLPTDGALS